MQKNDRHGKEGGIWQIDVLYTTVVDNILTVSSMF